MVVFFRVYHFFWLLIAAIPVHSAGTEPAPTPPTAAEFIAHLPEGALTLDLIISRGMVTSSSYQAALAGRRQTNADFLEAKSLLNTHFEVEASVVDDKNEAKTTVSPSSTSSANLRVRANKVFVTGTSVETEINHEDGEIAFNNFPTSVFKETRMRLQLAQDLWRDFGGRAIRWRLRAAEKSSEAQELDVDESTLDWMNAFTSLFYSAWLGQAQVRAAEQASQRKQRLLSITQLQLNRGTAELPDLYQVRRAARNAEISLADAQEEIERLWRQLIVLLKIHEAHPQWLKIDPMEIPIKLDDPVSGARRQCQLHPMGKEFETGAKAVRLKKARAEAALLRLKAAKDALRPQLKLAVGLVSNGVEPEDRTRTFNEAFGVENPSWMTALTLQTSLEKDAERAEASRAVAASQLADAEFESAQSDFVLDWLNRCSVLQHWVEKIDSYRVTLSEQKKRVSQEEKRFQLGRVPLLNVITAADESTETELQLNRAEVELRLAAWEVKRLTSEMFEYQEELRARLPREVETLEKAD